LRTKGKSPLGGKCRSWRCNWPFPLFTRCYGLDTTTVMFAVIKSSSVIISRKPFRNNAESFHFIPRSS